MKIYPETVEFLRDPEVQKCINEEDWDKFYELAYFVPKGQLNWLLYKAGLNPLVGLTEITPYFMSGVDIESLVIPDSIKRIGNRAFQNNKSLEVITIPNSVTSMGVEVFQGCDNLKEVIYMGSVTQWKRIADTEDFSSDVVVHCSDGDIRPSGKQWVKV